jgi:ElaB/YqjD/DUF883 family membrane-anchored ribosome-binding protein
MESTHQLQRLFNETEELLAELDDESAPGMHTLRGKLEDSMARTRLALDKRHAQEHVKLRDVAGSFNDYVRNHPWVALATGVLLASSIGIVATSATKRSVHH